MHPVLDDGDLENAFLRKHPPAEMRLQGNCRFQWSLRNVDQNIFPVVSSKHLHPSPRIVGLIKLRGLPSSTLSRSPSAGPWLNAISLASIGTMFMPHIIGIIVEYAINQETKSLSSYKLDRDGPLEKICQAAF